MGEKVRFGTDEPIHNGITYNFTHKGMSIITDEVIPVKSNIIIKIVTENGEVVTVEGKVIWVSSIPDLPPSMMGIKFNNPNEEFLRIYEAKKPRPE